MTPEQLATIQARADAATEGPWKVRACTPCTERGRLEVNIWDEPGNLMVTGWCDDDEFHRPDAEFIAAARTDVPALLALVRDQAAKLEHIRVLADTAPSFMGFPDSGTVAVFAIRAALTATEGAK